MNIKKSACSVGLLLLIWQTPWSNPAVASQQADTPIFAGVSAEFEILAPVILRNEPLKVRLIVTNTSNSAVSFRYFAGQSFIHHISIREKNGGKVPIRLNTHFGEMVATAIPLKPHQRAVRMPSVDLAEFYDLVPGEYYVQFYYDVRLIEDDELAERYMKRYHNREVVPWSPRRFRFVVR